MVVLDESFLDSDPVVSRHGGDRIRPFLGGNWIRLFLGGDRIRFLMLQCVHLDDINVPRVLLGRALAVH